MIPRGSTLLLALAGCPSPAQESEVPAPAAAPANGDADSGSRSSPQASGATKACPSSGRRFESYRWLPVGATVAASVDVGRDDLRTVLGQLSEYARGPQSGLPIDIAFALGQWSWQVPLIRTTLASAGFDPAELVYIRLPTGQSAWVFVTGCEFDRATTQARRAWGIEIQRTAGGATGTTDDPDGSAFAYDVMFLPADRIALVPAGTAAAFERALSRRADSTDSAVKTPPVGPLLEGVEASPVRLIVSVAVAVTTGGTASVSRLRVDAAGVTSGRLSAQSGSAP